MGRKRSDIRTYPKYTPPPETEIRLTGLQELYLDPKCRKDIRDRYFMIMKSYARSLLLKEMKRKGIILPPERVEELSVTTTLLVLNQYQREGWRISASFAGALRWKVIEALYGESKDEMNFSLNRTFSDESNAKEMLDLMSNNNTPWYKHISQDPADEVIDNHNGALDEIRLLIDQAYEILPYRVYVRFLPWLLLKIRKPKARNIMLQFNKFFLNSKEEEAFDILLLEMRNRIMMHVK